MQDLLGTDVKPVNGTNIRLIISNLSSEHTVDVRIVRRLFTQKSFFLFFSKKFIGTLKTMKDLDEFLTKNHDADGIIILSVEANKRQVGFYVKKYEHLPPINEYIQREEHGLELRERGIPINQAKLKLFEQNYAAGSSKEIQTVIEQFVNDFVPQNSS